MALDEQALERLIAAGGYDSTTPLVVGVSSPSLTLFAAQGTGTGPGELGCTSVGYGGSIAKQVTGACAALLAQRRLLDIEMPIAHYLPELPAWAGAIRVRHLIHHTAGLPTTDAVWDEMTSAGESDWTSDGVLAALSRMNELQEQPGHAYAYSNVGYICLARIVERSSGTGLDTFAQKHLFAPLRMRATTLWSGPAPFPSHAALSRSPQSPAPLSLGDGGLWTSVSDLLRWNQALFGDTLGVADTLHTTGALDDGTPLDYAWGVRVYSAEANRVQSHGGSWESATSKLVRLPDLGVSFAALAEDGSVERMSALSSLLQDELLDRT